LVSVVNNNDYDTQEWLKSFTLELVLAVDLKTYSQSALCFHFVFLLRRIVFVAAIFALEDYGIFQVMVILSSSLACLIYVGWVRPYKNEMTNALEMFNECCIFLSAHLCLIIQATRG
jgi:hypothetical protein